MKITTAFLGAVIVAAVWGCDNPGKAQKEADQARSEADEKVVKAQREADLQKAQAEANSAQKQQQANLSLVTAQNDYRGRINALLIDLDRNTADLRAKNAANPSKAHANDDALAKLATKREALSADLRMLEGATAGTWESVKGQIERDLTDARASLSPVMGKT